jgi:hypothetical protein
MAALTRSGNSGSRIFMKFNPGLASKVGRSESKRSLAAPFTGQVLGVPEYLIRYLIRHLIGYLKRLIQEESYRTTICPISIRLLNIVNHYSIIINGGNDNEIFAD